MKPGRHLWTHGRLRGAGLLAVPQIKPKAGKPEDKCGLSQQGFVVASLWEGDMFCLTCGSPLGPQDAFCTSCGSAAAASSFSHFGAAATGLRPLGVGERLDAAFKAYRANFRTITLAILVIAVPFAIVEALIAYTTAPTTPAIVNNQFPGTGSSLTVNWNSLWTEIGGIFVILVLTWILTVWASAAAVQIVGRKLLGEQIKWTEALSGSSRRLGSLLWIFVLITVGWIVPIGVVAGLGVALFAANLHTPGVIILVVGYLAFIPYAVWFYVGQSLTVPVLMLEDVRGVAAIRRSFHLIRNTWWSVFGTLILAGLITGFAGVIIGVIFAVLNIASHSNAGLSILFGTIQRVISLVLVTPFSATVLVILAIDMRVRKEGFDLEILARDMEIPTSIAGSRPPTNQGSGFPSIGGPSAGDSEFRWQLPSSPPPETDG